MLQYLYLLLYIILKTAYIERTRQCIYVDMLAVSAKGEAGTSSPGRPVSHSEPGAVAQAESAVKNVLFILREEQVGFYMWLIFIKYR